MTREKKIKILIMANGLKCYEVAQCLQIAPCTLSTWFRPPMSKAHEKAIKGAVQALKEAECGGEYR